MSTKSDVQERLERADKPAAIVRTDDTIVVNENFAGMESASKQEFDGGRIEDLLAKVDTKSGVDFIETLRSGVEGGAWTRVLSDDPNGKLYRLQPDVIEHPNGDILYVEAHYEAEPDFEMNHDEWLAEFSNEKASEAAENIRVDSPTGKLSIAEIMLDMASSHSEIEQIKDGAFNLYFSLNERLQREELSNPDSLEVAVIRAAAEEAYKLGMRAEKGTEFLQEQQ